MKRLDICIFVIDCFFKFVLNKFCNTVLFNLRSIVIDLFVNK